MRTNYLCAGRPPEWWDTDNDGARLALALCRVCPARTTCDDGRPHPGVIRAGIAYLERGGIAPICHCGYPDDRRPDGDPTPGSCCGHCRTPQIRLVRPAQSMRHAA